MPKDGRWCGADAGHWAAGGWVIPAVAARILRCQEHRLQCRMRGSGQAHVLVRRHGRRTRTLILGDRVFGVNAITGYNFDPFCTALGTAAWIVSRVRESRFTAWRWALLLVGVWHSRQTWVRTGSAGSTRPHGRCRSAVRAERIHTSSPGGGSPRVRS
jgi:hypothetical protein